MSNKPLSIIVGSTFPNTALVIGPLPLAILVQTRLFSLSLLSRLYSSVHAPLPIEPVTMVGCVTLPPSEGALICTVGGGTLSLTVIIASSLALNDASLAVRRKA